MLSLFCDGLLLSCSGRVLVDLITSTSSVERKLPGLLKLDRVENSRFLVDELSDLIGDAKRGLDIFTPSPVSLDLEIN